MKTHAIIPIFIPHLGCGHDCVFCNQNIITARSEVPAPEQVKSTVETYLKTFDRSKIKTVELAFYGGSFTGIPQNMQCQYLEIAEKYKTAGKIDKIHMSTRPDYIDKHIVGFLLEHGVDVVELGAQSFDDRVLKLAKRGHSREDILRGGKLLKEAGIELGIQLMIGLPGDTEEGALFSAEETVKLKPGLARIYPTVVFPDTQLADMMKQGSYKPLKEEEALEITEKVYKILYDGNIKIMRVGLKSTDLVKSGEELGGDYHPAFRQLVESRIALKKILRQIEADREKNMENIRIISNSEWQAPAVGHKGSNRKLLMNEMGIKHIRYEISEKLQDMEFVVKKYENKN